MGRAKILFNANTTSSGRVDQSSSPPAHRWRGGSTTGNWGITFTAASPNAKPVKRDVA